MSTEATNRIDPQMVEAAPNGNGNGAKPTRSRQATLDITPEQAAEFRRLNGIAAQAESGARLAREVSNAFLRGIVFGHRITSAQVVDLKGNTLILRVPDGE